MQGVAGRRPPSTGPAAVAVRPLAIDVGCTVALRCVANRPAPVQSSRTRDAKA